MCLSDAVSHTSPEGTVALQKASKPASGRKWRLDMPSGAICHRISRAWRCPLGSLWTRAGAFAMD
eukprot:9042602-Pyramimonas_sp.AAC.1